MVSFEENEHHKELSNLEKYEKVLRKLIEQDQLERLQAEIALQIEKKLREEFGEEYENLIVKLEKYEELTKLKEQFELFASNTEKELTIISDKESPDCISKQEFLTQIKKDLDDFDKAIEGLEDDSELMRFIDLKDKMTSMRRSPEHERIRKEALKTLKERTQKN